MNPRLTNGKLMEITEEQRKRAETNRLAALAKRKVLTESCSSNFPKKDYWNLFKCRKISSGFCATAGAQLQKQHENLLLDPVSTTHLNERFRARLEICSPDSFSATPELVRGFQYPGEEECFRRLNECLSDVMPSHFTQNNGGGKACVYKLRDYTAVLKCLKSSKTIEAEEIPWATFNVVEKLSHSFFVGRWIPCRPEHFSDDKVDQLIDNLPKKLVGMLLPFQLEGVKFGLRRGGRCLIADEMGLGKTVQAIAIAGCFMNEGSVLVVCPAILRFSWAEELERWLPFCSPSDIHLVFGHRDNPSNLAKLPKVVVISYTMLYRLRKSMLEQEWALLIVDESHHVRCTKKASEPEEIKAVLDLATKVKHIVLLSGTPSLTRPGLLGKTKYCFAKTYCAVEYVTTAQGKTFQDFSKGIRLEELNVLLKQTVMIRRLKEHVLVQLPPKRRQIIRLLLKKSDIIAAKAAVRELHNGHIERSARETLDKSYDNGKVRMGQLNYQEVGIAKLSGFREWFCIHPLITETDGVVDLDSISSSQKMIIFAHHHKVLDGVQELVCEKGIGFVRIDGNTLARERQSAVKSFQSSAEVKIAIIGVTAGGVGLDFSSAQNVVFLELPQSSSLMLQAEDRAHRRGQTNAVNVYIFCAKDTLDESLWRSLTKSLRRVSSATNGKYDAIQEIEVDSVSYLKTSDKTETSLGDQLLKVAACDEPTSVNTEPQDKDVYSTEVDDEVAENINDQSIKLHKNLSCSTKTDIHHEDPIFKVVEVEKSLFIKSKMKENSEVETENLNRVLSPQSDQLNGGKDQAKEEQNFCDQTEKIHGPAIPIDTNRCYSKDADSLRFEVSQYTGRIHLYTCISGTDRRPRPLFLNFRPEELEMLTSDDSEWTEANSLKETSISKNALHAFIEEWNRLRPIERKKLLGKPLQLPLYLELCYLSENTHHNTNGILKIKSKRRNTPFSEISRPLPSNAVWKTVQICIGSGKKKKEYIQGWTLTDEPLCKLCQTPCIGNNVKMPQFFEDLFCNLGCYDEYRIRISSRSLRQELFQIEHGICSNCHLDCHKLVRYIKPLSLAMRREYVEKAAPNVARRKKLLDKLVDNPSEGNAWHADHIVPVYQGGEGLMPCEFFEGECRLENMRTLCVACHSDVTAAQCTERRSTRLKAKKQLKVIMKELVKSKNMASTDCRIKDDAIEDDLLVKVPGSAYSDGNHLSIDREDLEESFKA